MAWEIPRKEIFRGLDLNELDTDTAYLNVTTSSSEQLWLYTRSENCYLCPWSRYQEESLKNDASLIMQVSTTHPINFLVRSSGEEAYIRTDSDALQKLCETQESFGQYGVYDFNVDSCSMDTALEPVNTNLAILVCFLVYVAMALISFGLKFVPGKPVHKLERWLGWRAGDTDKPSSTSSKPRLRSLDTFRGITMALMLFVNDGGGAYWFFDHATWDGLYVPDLVFPWFMWIMGVCVPMSVKSNLKRETPLHQIIWQVTKRSVKLFCFGFILNTLGNWIHLEKLRVPGVLQRFAIAYFIVATMANVLAHMSFVSKLSKNSKSGLFKDVLDLAPHWFLMLGLLLVHQLIMWLVPAPGCLQGYRGPGGLHDWSPDRNNTGCIGGITGYIDRQFFGTAHIYGNPTPKSVYNSVLAFDPEGIFGSLTTIFQVWLGYQAGYTLQVYSDSKPKVAIIWLCWSVITGGLGCLLCGGRQFGGWIPLNKNLWSLSFVLVTSSFAFILLAILYFVIDMRNWWKGQPFVYAGMNSILLYNGHMVGYQLFPWHFMIGDMKNHAAKLPEALWGMSLWMFIAFVLYKKRVFITV